MRKYTNRILGLLDEGFYGEVSDATDQLITGLLSWMSEDDVKKFCFANGYQELFDELYEENDD